MLLELASLILEPLGFRVRTFRDPHAALEAFTQDQAKPWLLITDFSMQPITGSQLMDHCRDLKPDLKVLMVTGTIEEDIILNSPRKPDGFLPKPYQARELTALVQRLAEA